MAHRYMSAGTFEWGDFSEIAINSILESDARVNLWEGAVRSSKTICSLVRWLEYIRTGPPGPLIMVGRTERTLRRNVISVMQGMLGHLMDYHQGAGEVYIGGRTIYLAGANDERAQEKIRGLTVAGAYGDELSLWPESMYTVLLSRMSVDRAKGFFTTNPDSPYHWLKVKYIDRAHLLNMKTFHFRIEDNLTLSQDYIESLKKEYTGVWYQRFIEGRWVMAEGMIYDMYDPLLHVTKTLPEMKRYWVGVDYGTSNATVFLLVGLGNDNKLYVVDEYRHEAGEGLERSKTDAQYAMDFVNWLGDRRPEWIFIDPSAKSFRLELWNMRRQYPALFRVAPANNEVLDGIRRTASLLNARKLLIHENAKGLQKELSSYVWDEKAQERGEDKPLKLNDHGPDALRYVVNGITKIYNSIIAS